MKNPEYSIRSSEDSLDEDLPVALSAGEIVLGSLVAIDAQGLPLVSYPQCPDGIARPAITTAGISQADVGRQVALLFANGDLAKPIMIGLIYSPLYQMLDNFMLSSTSAPASSVNADQQVFEDVSLVSAEKHSVLAGLPTDNVRVDGKRVVIEGEEEVVLMCGESSITLKQNGKIVIRGKYLLSRASGVNRILGGSVEVN